MRHPTKSFFSRIAILVFLYAAIIVLSLSLAYEIRFDFNIPPEILSNTTAILAFVLGVKMVSLIAAKQVRSLITFFGVPDLLQIMLSMTGVSILILGIRFMFPELLPIPRGVILVDYLACTAALCSFRLCARLFRERFLSTRPSGGRRAKRIAIIGAGGAGSSLAKEFLSMPSQGFKPVAFFDDDVSKRNQLLHGIPVLGAPENIQKFLQTHGIVEAVIAMPSASPRRIAEIVGILTSLSLKVETIPSLEALASGRVKTTRLRPVEIEDLLGRGSVGLDHSAIMSSIANKVVLVTGAAGSIGSEICRKIATLGPSQLIMVDQSEVGLFYFEQEIAEQGYSNFAIPILADIVDEERLEAVFSKYKPQIVFHAAAYKHVHLMERQYPEAFQNNVIGTRRLAQCASKHLVSTFVLISTDKAVNPTSVMGATKRVAELQLQLIQASPNNSTKFMAVRFGNVLGSSGSVVPIFRKQIADGGPITITHPEVTRYFMTISEAAGLVLQAGVIGWGGEILVLDMGAPIRIVDLAKQMVALSGMRLGDDIEIRYTGLRPGEKLYEELSHDSELYQPTSHPSISRFTSQEVLPAGFDAAMFKLELHCRLLQKDDFINGLKSLVPEYTPYLD